jgi:hypothetical protein
MRAAGKPGQRYCPIFLRGWAAAAGIYVAGSTPKGAIGIQPPVPQVPPRNCYNDPKACCTRPSESLHNRTDRIIQGCNTRRALHRSRIPRRSCQRPSLVHEWWNAPSGYSTLRHQGHGKHAGCSVRRTGPASEAGRAECVLALHCRALFRGQFAPVSRFINEKAFGAGNLNAAASYHNMGLALQARGAGIGAVPQGAGHCRNGC